MFSDLPWERSPSGVHRSLEHILSGGVLSERRRIRDKGEDGDREPAHIVWARSMSQFRLVRLPPQIVLGSDDRAPVVF